MIKGCYMIVQKDNTNDIFNDKVEKTRQGERDKKSKI